MHQQVGIPQQNPLVPAGRGHPAAGAKQTPVDTGNKLGVSVHDAHLRAGLRRRHRPLRLVRGVVPQPHRHVVAGADQDVARMGTPGQPAHGILVAVHDGQRPAVRIADVKRSNQPVDAAGGDDGVAVLVPVVCEDFRGRRTRRHGAGMAGRRVDGDGGGEVVFGGGGHAEVEYAEMRVGRGG